MDVKAEINKELATVLKFCGLVFILNNVQFKFVNVCCAACTVFHNLQNKNLVGNFCWENVAFTQPHT